MKYVTRFSTRASDINNFDFTKNKFLGLVEKSAMGPAKPPAGIADEWYTLSS
jgi:hypothetical protein